MSTEAFVDQLYRSFLYREPDEAGKADWVNRINSGQMSAIHVTRSFMDSAEYEQRVDSIAKMYFMFFGRIPDQAGMEYWQAQLDAGKSLTDITYAFSQSEEYNNIYNTDSDSDFLDIFYTRVFNRLPDDRGKQTWLDKLAGGHSRLDVFTLLADSWEFDIEAGTKVTVSSIYYGLLGRLPTETEVYEAINTPSLVAHAAYAPGLIEHLYNAPEYQGVLPPTTFLTTSSHYYTSEDRGSFTISVTRKGYLGNTTTVRYEVQSSEAEAGVDINWSSEAITFEPGETVKTITLDIINDSVPEIEERFEVQLTSDDDLPFNFPTPYLIIDKNDRLEPIQIDDLPTQNRTTFQGTTRNEKLGSIISAAGDLNGDGFADFILGSEETSTQWLIFGHSDAWGAEMTTDDLGNGTTAIALKGQASAISPAGDVNGDGFDDLIIGNSNGSPDNRQQAGESYLIFGHAGDWESSLDLSTLDGDTGITIIGTTAGDMSGISVGGGGDFNGDGFDDLLIGTPNGLDPGDGERAHGLGYIVFGHNGEWQPSLELADVQGATGYTVAGRNNNGLSTTIADVGDVNGDGIDDLFISEYHDYPSTTPPYSYLIFGRSDGWESGLDLSNLNADQGVSFLLPDTTSTVNVAGNGDYNNDGLTDFVISLPYEYDIYGRSFVIYGQREGWEPEVDLQTPNIANASIIVGATDYDRSGIDAASIGDANNDGIDDLFITARLGGSLLYGHEEGFGDQFSLYTLTPEYGNYLEARYITNVSNVGDINQDGYSDLLLSDGYGNNSKGVAQLYWGSDQLFI